MASPRTRRVLQELKPQDDNSVSPHEYIKELRFKTIVTIAEMFRMWHSQSTVGFGDLWDMDMFGMLRETSRPGRAFIICTFGYYGQLEGY